jgi:ElaB/YqjD/DUF883 family membrane-anchored ribosome-binding protein
MGTRGRQSAAALTVAGQINGISRLAPPAGLTQAQRNVWLEVVNSKPADWFGTEHIAILKRYVQAVVTAEIIDQQLEAFDPAWLLEDDGLKRYEKLSAIRAREAGVINTYARSMRLTQQSIYRADKAATLSDKSKGRKPWQTIDAETD